MSNEENRETCFVITPIGEPNSDIRRHIDGVIKASIKPALEENKKYDVISSHELYDPTSITSQIYQYLNESKLVIANLTELNPNVMYELAVRFCIGKPVIIIAEEGTKLPFDVKDQRTIFYINDSQGTIDLKNNIVKAVEAIDFDGKPSSPIFDSLNEIALFKQLENSEKSDAGISDKVFTLILDKLDRLDLKLRNIEIRDRLKEKENHVDDVYIKGNTLSKMILKEIDEATNTRKNNNI